MRHQQSADLLTRMGFAAACSLLSIDGVALTVSAIGMHQTRLPTRCRGVAGRRWRGTAARSHYRPSAVRGQAGHLQARLVLASPRESSSPTDSERRAPEFGWAKPGPGSGIPRFGSAEAPVEKSLASGIDACLEMAHNECVQISSLSRHLWGRYMGPWYLIARQEDMTTMGDLPASRTVGRWNVPSD